MPSTFSHKMSPEQFESLAFELARDFEADLYLSAPGFPGSGRSVIGLMPRSELIMDAGTSRDEIHRFCFGSPGPTGGYIGYNYGYISQHVSSAKTSKLPLGHLKKYTACLQYANGVLTKAEGGEESPQELATYITKSLQSTPQFDKEKPLTTADTGLITSLSRDEYIDGVRRTIDYIKEGYVYQLNLSIKYNITLPGLLPLDCFRHFWRRYPAAFYALFKTGDYTVVSTSPERFLKVAGERVLSQPIKGTLAFDEYDASLTDRLVNTPKEDAELSMIVDMIRNDISLNCAYGSVAVDNHKSTFVIDRLIQMYSDVSGRLAPGKTCLDLLLDAFPGGSITGCPKKKAMELIDELEPHSRDVYCGSLVIIEDETHMDSSIAIRTGYFDRDDSFSFFAGSGIVVESDPESEYLETVAKAAKFLNDLKSET